MDEIKNLESIGLVLPSPLYIVGAILFGIVGYFAFKRGRKTPAPALTWTGVKDTGRGTSLSYLGFHSVTRPKSYHLKKA